MAIAIAAAALPAVQVPAALLTPASPMPPGFASLAGGESGPGSLSTPFNKNALQAAACAEGGGGGYGIEAGLAIGTAANLSLPITAGRANIRGRVTLAASVLAISPSITRAYVWLSAGGVLSAVNNSTTPPAGEQLFLGSCVSSASAITSVDTSGVMYLRGGMLWRETADAGMPADTPPATVAFFNKTAGGLYLWDGTRYWLLAAP